MTLDEKIQANAELVAKQLNLGFDEASVKWLDGYIERLRLNPTYANSDQLKDNLGCFLGECIRRVYGGEWVEDQYGLSIRFDPRNGVFPHAKVAKQFKNGSAQGDSVYGLYTSIGPIFKRSPAQ
jgi:hypothetical protein